jgi:hypothetical protein
MSYVNPSYPAVVEQWQHNITREQWLHAAVQELRPDFEHATLMLPASVRVSVGFPSRHALARNRRAIGQCWDATATEDQIAQIYISPLLDDSVEVLAVLVHELVHASVGCECGHRGAFVKGMRGIGLEGKPTATHAGEKLATRLRALATALGPFPHARLHPGTASRKQTTRLLKVSCDGCGYICRVTRRTIDGLGTPICPSCLSPMKEKGLL